MSHKTILLVGNDSTNPVHVQALGGFLKYMQTTLGDGVTLLATYLDRIQYTIEPGRFEAYDAANAFDLAEADAIYIRGPELRANSPLAYYLSRYCVWQNLFCPNDYSRYYPGTKVAQSIVCIEQGAPILPTIYAYDKQLLLAQARTELEYPYILKSSLGAHGDANYMVHSSKEAKEIIAREPDVDFLAQRFCPNDRDYRLLIVGSQELLFERRGSADTHLNNTSKGAEAVEVPISILPPKMVQQARELAAHLKLAVAGVDIMPHLTTGALYILEINSQPQLLTGALVEQKKQLVRRLFSARP